MNNGAINYHNGYGYRTFDRACKHCGAHGPDVLYRRVPVMYNIKAGDACVVCDEAIWLAYRAEMEAADGIRY